MAHTRRTMRLLRPWMSVRQLATCPWARVLLVALALMQCIAPTWHVCSLGGQLACHQESGSASGHGGGHGKSAGGGHSFPVIAEEAGAQAGPQPVICICLPESEAQAEGDPEQPVLTSAPAHGDPQCLALMLQSMPGHGVLHPELLTFAALHSPQVANGPEAIAIAEVRAPAGRGPPAFASRSSLS